jgi:hypothetical protein
MHADPILRCIDAPEVLNNWYLPSGPSWQIVTPLVLLLLA